MACADTAQASVSATATFTVTVAVTVTLFCITNVAENGNDSVVFFLHVIKVTGEQWLSLQSQQIYIFICRTEKVDFQIIEPRLSFISGQKVEDNRKLGEAFSNVILVRRKEICRG